MDGEGAIDRARWTLELGTLADKAPRPGPQQGQPLLSGVPQDESISRGWMMDLILIRRQHGPPLLM